MDGLKTVIAVQNHIKFLRKIVGDILPDDAFLQRPDVSLKLIALLLEPIFLVTQILLKFGIFTLFKTPVEVEKPGASSAVCIAQSLVLQCTASSGTGTCLRTSRNETTPKRRA